jgi:hypothetical protein
LDTLNQCVQLLNLSKIPSLVECQQVGLRITYSAVLDRMICPGYGGVIEEVMDRLPSSSYILLFIYLIMTLDDTPHFNYQLIDKLRHRFKVEDVSSYLIKTLQIGSTNSDEILNLMGIDGSNILENKLASRYCNELVGQGGDNSSLRQLIRMDDELTKIVIEIHKEIMPYHRAIVDIIKQFWSAGI